MKKTTPHWIAIGLLLAVIVGIGVKVIVLGSTGKSDDGRIAVILTPVERQLVLGEMRMLLEASQAIIEALTNNDLAAVEKTARPLGAGAIATVDFALRAKLPLEFKNLGFGTHYALDDIANMARDKKPAKEIQLKLADTMNNCIACHAMYQLPEIKE